MTIDQRISRFIRFVQRQKLFSKKHSTSAEEHVAILAILNEYPDLPWVLSHLNDLEKHIGLRKTKRKNRRKLNTAIYLLKNKYNANKDVTQTYIEAETTPVENTVESHDKHIEGITKTVPENTKDDEETIPSLTSMKQYCQLILQSLGDGLRAELEPYIKYVTEHRLLKKANRLVKLIQSKVLKQLNRLLTLIKIPQLLLACQIYLEKHPSLNRTFRLTLLCLICLGVYYLHDYWTYIILLKDPVKLILKGFNNLAEVLHFSND